MFAVDEVAVELVTDGEDWILSPMNKLNGSAFNGAGLAHLELNLELEDILCGATFYVQVGDYDPKCTGWVTSNALGMQMGD